MKSTTLVTMLLVIQCLATGSAIAHPGHDHELTKDQAILRGTAIVSSLVKKETQVAGQILDAGWTDARNPISCQETPEYYLIAVKNRATGQSVFLLLTSAGKYLRANFDGHFADLTFSSFPVLDC